MKAAVKTRIKKAVDVCMTLLLLCLMAYQVTGEVLHEWGGIGMTALLILHHILNFRWYRSLFKGKYTAYRVLTVTVNTLLLLSIGLTAACGMAMSAHAAPFLYGMLPVSFARQVHLAGSFWSFILMGVHLGLHVPAMTAGCRRSGRVRALLGSAAAVAAGIGVWLFHKNGIAAYIFLRIPFAFFDYDKGAVPVFLENLAMLTAFAFIGKEAATLIRGAQSRAEGRKARIAASLTRILAAALIGGAASLPAVRAPGLPSDTASVIPAAALPYSSS